MHSLHIKNRKWHQWRVTFYQNFSSMKIRKDLSKLLATSYTLFENYSKFRIPIFQYWHIPSIFVLLKLTCLLSNTVWPNTSDFQKKPKLSIFGIFNAFLSHQNINVARFARNIECDFFWDFQTLWSNLLDGILPPRMLS